MKDLLHALLLLSLSFIAFLLHKKVNSTKKQLNASQHMHYGADSKPFLNRIRYKNYKHAEAKSFRRV